MNRKARINYLKAIQAGKPITPFYTPSVVITSGNQGYINSIGIFPIKELGRFIPMDKTIFLIPDNNRSELFNKADQ